MTHYSDFKIHWWVLTHILKNMKVIGDINYCDIKESVMWCHKRHTDKGAVIGENDNFEFGETRMLSWKGWTLRK